MKRIISTAIAAAGLTLGTLAIAQPAQAITNPADNPSPITVKGDDGKTYTDGEDTLPGYDDEACTYIPGAYFDFDNNRVRYADGKSIPWTEWERATGYKEWKAQQNKPAPAPTTKTTAPAPKTTKTTAPKPKPAATAAPKPRATAKPAASKTSATPSATPTTSAPSDDVATADAATTPDATEPTTAAPAAATAEDASEDTEDVNLAAESTDTKAATESEGTGSAGLLILGGLAGAGLLAVAGYSVVSRRKGSAS